MRFLIFVFNAYSTIFVTSLVKEPENLRFPEKVLGGVSLTFVRLRLS